MSEKTKTPKILGEVQRTERGFEIIEFSDYCGAKCSLQASSLAIYVQPGTSAIWLGCEENVPPHHVTGEPMSPRMHLDDKQVRALVRHLQRWLKVGTFEVPR